MAEQPGSEPGPESEGFELVHAYSGMSLYRREDVALLRLNRPERLNALTRADFRDLPAAVASAEADAQLRALVITGAGRAFCAGADVKDVLLDRLGKPARLEMPEPAGREWKLLGGARMPVVAAVNGPAAGAGLGLALMSDYRIGSPECFFVEAHVARGLTPSVASFLLPRYVGLGLASEMILLDRRLQSEQALQHGLLNAIVDREQLLAQAYAVAARLAALPEFAVTTAKESIRLGLESSLQAVRQWSGQMEAVSHALSAESLEASAGFLTGPRGQDGPRRQDEVGPLPS